MDTPRYRIGNDLTIFWAINNRDGSPYDLDGKEVRLFMTHERGREEVEAQITQLEPGIRNNVIRWDFKAEDQRILGKYTLTFVVLESDTHRELTKDYGEAFTLVGRSEMENEEGDANISTGGDLILSTKLDIYRIQATNVDVAGLKNQIYDVEKGLTTKVEKETFDAKTGELEDAYTRIETTVKGISTTIKDTSGEITEIKQSIDGIEISVGDLEYRTESLEKQTDGAIEKWFYPGVPGPDVLPESNWKTDQEKYSHLGDLYYDENTGIAYRYTLKDNVFCWVVIQDSDITAALEAAKNNNKTFIDQPRPPYKVGDLWIAEKRYEEAGIEQNDIVVCIVTREEGQFDITDWEKRSPGINDEDLEDFVDRYYEDVILPEISKQADKQARAYYGPDDPSLEWEEGTESEHIGDLWYDTNSNKAYYWSGTAWVESDVPEEVFDKIDGKNSIFVSKPEGVAYKENDLWFTEQDYDLEGFRHHKGEILVALEDAVYDAENETYIFSYADWAKRDTYTDDTAVKDLDDYIRTGFKDGVLTESEKQSISSAWDSIVLAQDQLTQDYLTVILPGFTLPEFDELQKAYKVVYNEELTDEYPDLGTFQILEQKVNDVLAYEPTYEPTVDEEAIAALIDAYDEAYDAYRMALSNYTTAYAEFVNAVRAELGQANEYIEAIIDDGKLTPIEKKQLLEVYKGIAVEYDSNVDTAFTAKIWKFDEEGNEVPGAYAGPKGEGQDYFDVYIAYKAAYSPILAVFTGTDWGFDKMDETTVFDGDVDLSTLKDYLDVYYEALRSIAHVISVVAEEKAEASLAMKQYMDDLEEVLTPTESITQIGKGVVLSSVIGVGTYDEESGKYLLKAGMNATAKETEDLVTMSIEHGRIVFVGGANGKTDWNEATFVVYEDGYVHFRAGKIDKNVQIGEAVLQAVIADEINLLSYPEYDEETGETKLTPLFQVNTRTDASGKKKIVSVSSVYDFYINGNLIVAGDTSSTAQGEDAGTDGTLIGVKVGDKTYAEAYTENGILNLTEAFNNVSVDLSGYYTREETDAKIAGLSSTYATKLSLAALQTEVDNIESILGMDEEAEGIINTWNEVKAFLAEIEVGDDLASILEGINTRIGNNTTAIGLIDGRVTVNEAAIADNATNIRNAKGEIDSLKDAKADWGTTLAHYGITDAYTKAEVAAELAKYLLLESANQTIKGNITIEGNLIVKGDTSSTARGTDSGTDGTLIGVIVNGTRYEDETNGMLDLSSLMNQYALATEIPSLDGYAKLTDIPSLEAYALKTEIPTTMAWTAITGKPSFASVATSGSYNDLSNKPTIPTTLPASDVYAWAKAATKPSYKTSEIAEETNLYFTNARAVSALADTLKDYVTKTALASDLGEYASKEWVNEKGYITGITLTGDDYISVNGYKLSLAIDAQGGLTNTGQGLGIYQIPSAKIVTDALGYTPLSTEGGTIAMSSYAGFSVRNTSDALSVIRYRGNVNDTNTILGYLGFNGVNNPIFMSTSGNPYTLIHSNNYSSYALPLSGGGVILGEGAYAPLVVNANIGQTGVGFRLQVEGTNKALLAWDRNIGTYMYNSPSGKYIGIKDDGTPYYNNGSYNTLYHTGNFNPSDYLLKSGGKITSSNYDGLIIKRASDRAGALIVFENNGGRLGIFGFEGSGKVPIVYFGSDTSSYEYLIHSGNIGSYNAGSATKLQTARTIWGQSFDGTDKVRGALSDVTNIDFESNNLYDIGSNSRQARYIYAGWVGSQTGKTLSFGANNGTHMLINSSGNVLIGTTTDSGTKLYVSGDTRFDGQTRINGSMRFYGKTNLSSDMYINNQSVGGLNFTWSDGVSRFFIGDNVGIGTTNPAYKLDVSGSIYASQYVIANYALITKGEYGVWKGSSFSTVRTSDDLVYFAVTHDFRGAVTMSSTLSVGGNISAPSAVIKGNSENALTIGSEFVVLNTITSGGWHRGYRFTHNDNIKFAFGAFGSGGTFNYGYVGTTYTDAWVKFTQAVTTINGNLVVSGDTATGSDIRFKDKLSDHRIAISDIAEAPLFTFKWNDREDDSVHLGSSAQYWEKVAPWLVRGEDFKTLDYSTLGVAIGISLANKAVNHEERIKILEKENKALKEQIRRIQYGS